MSGKSDKRFETWVLAIYAFLVVGWTAAAVTTFSVHLGQALLDGLMAVLSAMYVGVGLVYNYWLSRNGNSK